MMKPIVLTLVLSCVVFLGCKGAAFTSSQPNVTQNATNTAYVSPSPQSQPTSSPQASLNDGQVFDSILELLLKKTRVPLRLPKYLALEHETNRIYVILESASPSHYQIQLAFTENCSGGNVCHYGVVYGRKINSLEKPKGKQVSLSSGIDGYFIEAACGATCSDSTLTWDDKGFRYTVGLKAANMETLMRIANSASAKK